MAIRLHDWHEVYEPFPDTLLPDVNAAAPEQCASFGPYSLKVIVPVGPWPPASLAVS